MLRYKPYHSDSESSTDSESESESDSSNSSVHEGFEPANYKALADGLAASNPLDVSGMDYNGITTRGKQFAYPISSGAATFANYEIQPDPSGNLLKSVSQNITNVVTIDSKDRDRTIFPQPTNLTLRLPRIYKNVTGFTILQMKFLSAFYYFSAIKQNISISILELGRLIPGPDGTMIDDIIVNLLREGTYDINGLISELTVQLNRTPVFYDYQHGFQDFAKKFSVTGDYSLGFNYPGDTYYDALLGQYIPNPTTDTIVSRYFLSRYAGLSSYTVDQIKIAYYYPVLKEATLDTVYSPLLNYTLVTSAQYLLVDETPQSRVVYTFQGINDPVILELIQLNTSLLDTYRVNHTFRYSLINKYNISYETQTNRVIFQCPTLNTSLVNLLNYKQAQFFAEQLSFYGLTPTAYANLNTQTTILLAVLNDMVAYYQEYLAIYFGIQYNTFSMSYLLNSAYPIPIRNAYNAIGINSNFNANSANQTVTSNSILTPFQRDAPQYWNRMKGLSTTIAYMNPVIPGESGDASMNYFTWNADMDQQDTRNPLVLSNVLDSNNPNTTTIGNLYVNRRTQFADAIIPLESSKYTVFRFKSPVRQTLRVETLPRPTKYRYPAYNAVNYDLSHQQLFDNSYSFVGTVPNMDVSDNTFTSTDLDFIPGFSSMSASAAFGASFSTSLGFWAGSTATISIIQPRIYYEFISPVPPAPPPAPAYTYPLSITVANANPMLPFATPLQLFLYQDRGAFMADISGNGKENPRHFIGTVSSITDASAVTLTFLAYANRPYYTLTRSQNNSFATDSVQVVPSFPSSMAYTALTSTLTGFDPLADPTLNLTNYNYAQVADPAFIKLPIASTLYPPPSVDPIYVPLTFSTGLMGYDTTGVSTDLTNYVGYISNVVGSNSVPNSMYRIDPTNGFIIHANSPYNSNTGTYFYTGGSNAILYPYASGVYSTGTISYRQESIVNWYGNTFLPPSQNQVAYEPTDIAYSAIPAFTGTYPLSYNLNGYTYYTRNNVTGGTYIGSPSLLDTGDGVIGIGFLPEDGTWEIDRFMFKSIFTNSATDPNSQIRYLGIFPAVITSNTAVQNIRLSNAVAILAYNSSITYNSSNQNFGFDKTGGTYYEFTRSSPLGSNAHLYGTTQSAYEYNFDLNSYYVAIPYTANSNITNFYGLVGSIVPYPYYSEVTGVPSAPSPQGPIVPPTGADIILPNGVFPGANPILGPPVGYTATQCKYEQSMTSVGNLFLYAQPYAINDALVAFKPWEPLPYAPTEIVSDCSGFILVKDSVFRVFSYGNTSTLRFHESYQITLDEVFPAATNISYLATAANESNFAFFGILNTGTSPYLCIRTLNPQTGIIRDAHQETLPIGFHSSVQLFRATYNNYGGYVMTTKSGSNISVVSKAQGTASSFTYFHLQTPEPIEYYVAQQSPKEQYGRFWVFPFQAAGFSDFAFVNPNITTEDIPGGNYVAETIDFPGGVVKYANIIYYNLSNQTPNVFRSPIVTRDVERDRLYFLSDADPTKFFEAPITTGVVEPAVVTSQYSFPSTPTNMYAGARGAIWANMYDTLFGNRLDGLDAPKKVIPAWQIFYPVHRIVFHQISKNFDFMLDLSGREYPEYPHTAVAVYDSSGAITRDTSGKWGLESSGNFVTGDFNISGYYFNAYDYIIPLRDNRASDDYYYMTARNYIPTEKSQVTIRVSAPNKYTFGYVTPLDISGEISTAKYTLSTNDLLYTYYWDNEYAKSLLAFDSNFVIGSNGKTFGANVIEGYAGSNISSVTGFGDFYGRMKAVYSTYSTISILASTINATTNSNVNAFVQTDLQSIIPASALNRQRFTDPLRFSIKWKSPLSPQFANLEDSWGLGWNLGFAKADTAFETIQKGSSFFKIIDDFINLRMNAEFDMNRMDTSSKENLAETQEPQGATKAFYGKLLLASFGSYAQTMISNPIAFLSPLGKMDRLTFQWLDTTGAIIDNDDCEWNAVVQISEKVDTTIVSASPPFDPTARAAPAP